MRELKHYKSKNHKVRDRRASIFLIVFSNFLILFLYNTGSIWFLVLSFILGVFLLFNSFKKRKTVVLNEKGISSKANGMGLIEWKYINGFSLKKSYKSFSFLVADINDVESALKSKN